MPHFCCAGQCENSSDKRPDISFHGLPLDNKALLKTWITKMRRHPNYFNVRVGGKVTGIKQTLISYDNKRIAQFIVTSY